jgi:hypothetical protein
MECAMRIATDGGGPRCPVCRRNFETITQKDDRYTVNIQTKTLYRSGVPYLVLSAKEMKIASLIVVDEGAGESGTMNMNFYIPNYLHDFDHATGWSLVSTNADDGPVGRAMTRSDTIEFSYDKDKYRDELQIGVAKLLDLMKNHDMPLFFLKAQVSSSFTKMVTIGKFHLQTCRSHPEDPTDDLEHILSMPFPAASMANLASIMSID